MPEEQNNKPSREESPNIETGEISVVDLDFEDQVELSLEQLEQLADQRDTIVPVSVTDPSLISTEIIVALKLTTSDCLPPAPPDQEIPDFIIAKPSPVPSLDLILGSDNAAAAPADGETVLPPPGWDPKEITDSAPDPAPEDASPVLLQIPLTQDVTVLPSDLKKIWDDFEESDMFRQYKNDHTRFEEEREAYLKDPDNQPKPTKCPSLLQCYMRFLAQRKV